MAQRAAPDPPDPPPHASGGDPPGPDPLLVGAAAMVFVGDVAEPELGEDDAYHLLDVLRLRPGEQVVASDGAGRWVPCRLDGGRVAGTGGRRTGRLAGLVVDGPVRELAPPRPAVTVGFVPAKGDRPEWVVRGLTELGVDRIVPVASARSVVRWDEARGDRAVARLRRVAKEAASQCRRPRLPEVLVVTPLDALGARTGLPTRLAHPGGSRPSLDPPVLVAGPEGGWDPAELERFGPGVGLGPTVLRADTAALTAGAVLCGLRSGLVGSLA